MTETAPDHETQPDAYALGVANAQARLDGVDPTVVSPAAT